MKIVTRDFDVFDLERGDRCGGLMRRLTRHALRRAALTGLRVTVTYSRGISTRLSAGRCVVTCNHVSLLDGVIVALASPVPLVFAVDTEYSRQSDVAVRGLKALAWLGFGTVVPVDSGAPFGMRALLRAVARGENVMVFPEGQISTTGSRGPDQAGLSWLLQRADARVVELRIQGAEKSRLFAKRGQQWWPAIKLWF
ncbi:1-acyl-sn-glycerol-3-phosphate acyltransferase [Burkholderia sp. LMG 13014]|uniref:1-acyl-sn-glycerol-3-phosphate acyltransferase n=1 Tax=Burkholderia sp. LMG 13014 TaxID=2709306 RepID=UPI001965EF94|nr:1-acyl-sn-glycerol-3-phosphate acyltransferase [Burkholderia sp. LMG 13014]